MATVNVLTEDLVQLEDYAPQTYETLPSLSIIQQSRQWIHTHCTDPRQLQSEWFITGLRQGRLIAICDGSYKPNLTDKGCTASWIIEDSQHNKAVKGKLAISNMKVDAYRGELLGILQILSAIQFAESKATNYDNGSIRLGCDNEKAGWLSGQYNTRVKPSSKHMDLIKAIRHMQKELKTKVTFYHLYGHQDKTKDFDSLPRDAQLNVLVDHEAQLHLDNSYESQSFRPNMIFPCEGWHVFIGGIKITDNHAHHIRDWVGKYNLREYLYNKGLISWNSFQCIDFSTLEKYISQQSQYFRLWFIKHWTGFCGIGAKMKVMGLWTTDLCPCCRQIPERSAMHLYQCPEETMSSLRNKLFTSILEWMEEVDTCPKLLAMITSFWKNQLPSHDEDTPPQLHKIYNILREIGVQSMWSGFLPLGLIEYQHSHYQLLGKRNTGNSWGNKLVGKLLRATHQLWLHRNSILHAQTENELKVMDIMQLQDAVQRELDKGKAGLPMEDWDLLDINIHDMMTEPVDYIRGWLCTILIARGDIAAAKEENMKDRRNSSPFPTNITDKQRKEFMDWRNICIK